MNIISVSGITKIYNPDKIPVVTTDMIFAANILKGNKVKIVLSRSRKELVPRPSSRPPARTAECEVPRLERDAGRRAVAGKEGGRWGALRRGGRGVPCRAR